MAWNLSDYLAYFDDFPAGNQAVGFITSVSITSKISPTMPVAFLYPIRIQGQLDPSPDEIVE